MEGPHLVSAAAQAGLKPVCVLVGETRKPEVDQLVRRAGAETIELSDRVFRAIVDAETPQGIAAEIEIPAPKAGGGDHVFLEGVQDAGNVGAILRTAAAFGISTVVLDRACADPWSPKVLRAGMGGHFSLSIEQVPDLRAALERFHGQILCTVAKGGVDLRDARLSHPLAWIFGSEGKGVTPSLQKAAALRVTIVAPGVESLNVAAAAAVCLYESASRPAAGS